MMGSFHKISRLPRRAGQWRGGGGARGREECAGAIHQAAPGLQVAPFSVQPDRGSER